MPEMTGYEHGVPSWVDIGTQDPGAGVRFYTPDVAEPVAISTREDHVIALAGSLSMADVDRSNRIAKCQLIIVARQVSLAEFVQPRDIARHAAANGIDAIATNDHRAIWDGRRARTIDERGIDDCDRRDSRCGRAGTTQEKNEQPIQARVAQRL